MNIQSTNRQATAKQPSQKEPLAVQATVANHEPSDPITDVPTVLSRTKIFETMKNVQAEEVSRGDFRTAERVLEAERGLQKISGDDAVALLRNVEKKRTYWNSSQPNLWKIPAWGALAVGPGAAVGGLIGYVTGNTGVGAALGAIANLTTTAVLAYAGKTTYSPGGYVRERGCGPLKGFIDLEKDKDQHYYSIALELKRASKQSLASTGVPVETADRATLEALLQQLKDKAEKSAVLGKVIELEDKQEFLHRAKGDNLLEIFRQNKDRKSVAELIDCNYRFGPGS